MRTIIIPEILQPIASILTQYLHPILIWASQHILQQLVTKHHHHPLVQVANRLDFSELELACADYHKTSGVPGRPTRHTVPRLLRLLFLRYWYDLSLRRSEEHVRFNLLARWFVGYHLTEEVADHTTLHRFEAYLYTNHRALFFNNILGQIDALIDDGHEQIQIGDTFALRACAAMETIIQRLRHSSYQLLNVWSADDPQGYAAAHPKMDEPALFGLKTEKREYFLAQEEWRARLTVTVQAIESLLELLPPPYERSSAVQQRVAQLQKIMADELEIVRDDNGRPQSASYREKRGTFRIFSATDPDATIRNHGKGKKDGGYNISVAATRDCIRAIQADTGSTSDVTPIPDLLKVQAERGDTLPEKFIYDQIAGNGKTAHEVTEVSDGRTQLVAYPMPPKKKKSFNPEKFVLSEDGFWLTCPNGRRTNRRYRSGSAAGWNFRFMPPKCQGCALLKACRGSDELPTTHRDVFISDYRPAYDQLVAYAQTDEFKQDMKLRPEIERVIAGLVLHNGARYARFRGQMKVDFQVKMAATIYNVKHLLVRLDELAGRRRRPVRRLWGLPTPS